MLLNASRGLKEEYHSAVRDVDGDLRVVLPELAAAERSPRSLRAASDSGTFL